VDTPQALRESLAGVMLEVMAAPQREAIEALRGLAGIAEIEAFGERMHARWTGSDPASAVSAIEHRLRAAGLTVASVREVPASLEDVFINRVTAS
jgi:hypothetical protein